MRPDSCLFCRVFAAAAALFAVLVGAATAAQLGLSLGSGVDAHARLMPAVLSGVVRSLAPASTGSALLLAFVIWANPLPPARVEAELRAVQKRAALVLLPGYLGSVLLAFGAALVVAHLAFGVPWSAAPSVLAETRAKDWSIGGVGLAIDALLIVVLAQRYLARLQAGRASLPMKLVLAWTFGTGMRLCAAVVASLLLPA
jgi:hypothetical protein